MQSVADVLRTIAGSGEVVTIVYNAGSRPGQAREVVPLSVSTDELVAVEPGLPTRKHYKLARIASVQLSSAEPTINKQASPAVVSDVPRLATLVAYAQRFGPELRGAGWHVYDSEDFLAVATYFKNGKPKKTPSIAIQYSDPTIETVFDYKTGAVNNTTRELTGRERPWRVDSWRFNAGKSFGDLHRAFEVFMAEVRASHPATAKTLSSSR